MSNIDQSYSMIGTGTNKGAMNHESGPEIASC